MPFRALNTDSPISLGPYRDLVVVQSGYLPAIATTYEGIVPVSASPTSAPGFLRAPDPERPAGPETCVEYAKRLLDEIHDSMWLLWGQIHQCQDGINGLDEHWHYGDHDQDPIAGECYEDYVRQALQHLRDAEQSYMSALLAYQTYRLWGLSDATCQVIVDAIYNDGIFELLNGAFFSLGECERLVREAWEICFGMSPPGDSGPIS